MDFEEELFHLYQAEAEQSRQEFIAEHGYSDVSEMTRSDRSFYDINRANTVKGACRRFDDRLNCGGYAFEITSRLYPPKDNDYSKYVSGILDNFDFVRLLGNTHLQSDEYLVIYHYAKNFGHHFIKINNDGLVVEKYSYGTPKVFQGWHSKFSESPDIIFAVKQDHDHHFVREPDFSQGRNFGETVQQAISDRQNSFSYHCQNYRLKRTPSGEIVIIDEDSTKVVASVSNNDNNFEINIAENMADSIENFSGRIKPQFKNGKLINLDDF